MRKIIPCPVDSYLPLLFRVWRKRRRESGESMVPGAPGRLSDNELHDAASAVKELSRGFTRDRSLAGAPYMEDPRLLGAYLLFYWPLSYAQAWAAILSAGVSASSGPRALDVGSGPGPASFALSDMGFRDVTAVDRSAPALLRELSQASGVRISARRADLESESRGMGGPYDLVIAMHTLNELWPERTDRLSLRLGLAQRLARSLSPRGRLLLIEPALTAVANDAIALRDALLGSGWRVESPCTLADRCPALPEGTCHAEVQWEPPPSLTRLAHAARIGREYLAFSYFLLAPAPPLSAEAPPATALPQDALYRIVSERFLSKSGRLRVLICGPEGRFPLSVDGRATHPAARLFRSLNRYDLIRVENPELRDTGWGLTAESRLVIAGRAPVLGYTSVH
jgi:SAM-dependent methyltransferase